MKIWISLLSILVWTVSCQSTNIDFISSDRKIVTIGYINYADNVRRSEESNDTDSELAVNASIEYINNSKMFPFTLKLKTLDMLEPTKEGLEKNIELFKANMNTVALWIASKSTTINLALAPLSLESRVPMMFPITSKSLFTQGYTNLYQMTPSNSIFGYRTWDLAKQMNIKKLLLIEDSSIMYSGEYAKSFLDVNKVNKNSINIETLVGNLTQDKVNMYNEIKNLLKQEKFDAVFFPGFANDINAVLGIMEDVGTSIPMITGDEGGDPNIFNKLKGLNSVYYLSYYPIETDIEKNPKTKNNIQAFQKFYQTSGKGILVSQFYYSTTLLASEMIASVLADNPIFKNRDGFYELFNSVAKSKSFLALSDFPIQMQVNGTVYVNKGELSITKNTLKYGISNTGRI